ncbi:MAG: class I SAM-dependent methyltransferase [Brevefilum sp.]|jgi:predicted methyltransferase
MENNLIFSHYQTRALLEEAASETMLSLDLGLTSSPVKRVANGWQTLNGQVLTFDHICTINENENGCFILNGGEIKKVEVFSPITNRYYSLYPTEKAPTMLISGIPMHRIKDTTPDRDTIQKIKALGKPYGRILDTAMGLGYTAIQAAQTAQNVITIEFDPAVLTISRLNPWSRQLFSNQKITKLIGDSYDLVRGFADGSINAIIHDPPTFNLAGHLYSQSIYQDFYRVLRERGRLFHYVGDPNSRTGASTTRGVVSRLRNAGFIVSPKPKAFGVLAEKHSA